MVLISSLPPEILRIIFIYFKKNSWDDSPSKPLSRDLVSSMAVCRQWRNIIVNTSSLWTRIICVLPTGCDRITLYMQLSLLDVFLQRSGSAPLDVFISMNELGSEIHAKLWLFMMTKASFHRWRSLEISCWSLEPVNMTLVGDLIMLTSLSYFGDSFDKLPLLPIIDRSSKNLQEVGVYMFEVSRVLDQCPSIMRRISKLSSNRIETSLPSNITAISSGTLPLLPLPHVLHLTVSRFDVTLFNSSSFPRLEVLEITYEIMESTAGNMKTIPSLRSLIIASITLRSLARIIAPSLELLSINKPKSKFVQIPEGFDQALEDPHYQLSPTSLILDTHLPSDTLLRILLVSPRVESLQVLLDQQQGEWLVDILVEKLYGNSEAIDQPHPTWNLCPNLVTLQIRWTHNQTDSESCRDLLLRILQGRAGSPLKSASCIWEDGNEITVTFDAVV